MVRSLMSVYDAWFSCFHQSNTHRLSWRRTTSL